MTSRKMLLPIIGLIALSALIYCLQLLIFRTPASTAFYLLQDFAFLPVQVVIVTVIIGRAISVREMRERLSRINMMISAFFSELGSDLMKRMAAYAVAGEGPRLQLCVSQAWTEKDFASAQRLVKSCDFKADCTPKDLCELKELLLAKRMYIYIMLANPTLLEHEVFTDMLLAVFHLADELSLREDFARLPPSDISHLNLDVSRAFGAAALNWLIYMRHIKADYPYLFSIELRRNPFVAGNDVIVR
jgi:hypothetical protein